MKLWNKIISKNYWISLLIIVISIMLFQKYVSDFITKYVQFPEVILTFVTILLIVAASRLISEEILEVQI